MSATIREIVDAALTVVGEVTGAGVQQYEDDRMFDDAVRGFDMMFRKYEWRQYLSWFTITLDGILGIPTTDAFRNIKDFEDFVSVFRDGENTPLPIMPVRVNPSSLGLTGSRVLFWSSMNATNANYAGRKIQFYPATSIGDIQVLAKVYPLTYPATEFDWEDELHLDKNLLAYATAYMTLSGDDLNAGAADVVRSLMEMTYRDIMAALAKHPIPLSSNSSIPNYWSERA